VYESWNKVFKSLFFDLTELLNILETKNENIPVIIADDAGVHIGKYLWRIDVKRADVITRLVQVARTEFSSVIFTVPHPSLLAKTLRDEPDWIYVSMAPGPTKYWPPVSTCVIYSTLPTPKEVWLKRRSETIPFTVWLPDDIYKRYQEIRRKYSQTVREDFKRLILEGLAENNDRLTEHGGTQ